MLNKKIIQIQLKLIQKYAPKSIVMHFGFRGKFVFKS